MSKYADNLWGDLVREHGATLAQAERTGATRASRLRRPRVLAATTLGLAGGGTALALLLGVATSPPAFAVTRLASGTVLVTVNVAESTQPWVLGADQKLASMGIDEQIQVGTAPGPATTSGPVSCTPLTGVNTPAGPPVEVLIGTDGTQVIPAGNTGSGVVHLGTCVYYKTPVPGAGNTGSAPTSIAVGNTGSGSGSAGAGTTSTGNS